MKRSLLSVLVLGALVLGACGSDGNQSESPSTPPASDASATDTTGATSEPAPTDPATTDDEAPAGAFPVTIEHHFGNTTLDARPERIVAIDMQWTDVLRALDAPLVAAATSPATGDWYPWQDMDGVEEIDTDGTTIPYEMIAAQRPDLIVVTWAAPDQATYDQLNAIAPTIGLLSDRQVDAWQDIATAAGQVIGDPAAAEALIEDYDAHIAGLAAELPNLAGQTYSMSNYYPGDGIWVIADPDDGSARLFAQLGLIIDPDLVEMADGAIGRFKISFEEIGLLQSDVLLLLTNGADPNEIPGYSALPAVQRGTVHIFEGFADASAINTPSPLSVPWALDTIRPTLEAANDAS